MKIRTIKSKEEIEIIKNGARIADLGGFEIMNNIKEGATELEIAISGRDRMEREIAKTYPDAEYMDTWVWFQSGINTDVHIIQKQIVAIIRRYFIFKYISYDIRLLYSIRKNSFLNSVDDASLKAWEANIKVHKKGLELIKPELSALKFVMN